MSPKKKALPKKARKQSRPRCKTAHPSRPYGGSVESAERLAPDEANERLATDEEIAVLYSATTADPYAEFGGSVDVISDDVAAPDVPSGYVAGSAVAKYAPRVEDFGRLILWERVYLALERFQRFASRLRLGIVAESVQAFREGWRRSFERSVVDAASARLKNDVETNYLHDSQDRKQALLRVLVAVLGQDTLSREEMIELQRLPVGRFAFQARILAFDDAVVRHWVAAGMVVNRVDVRVPSLMASLRASGIHISEGAERLTSKALVRALCNDAALCTELAARHQSPSSETVSELIYSSVDMHLDGIVGRALRGKNGQPLGEDERAAVSARLFGEVRHNG